MTWLRKDIGKIVDDYGFAKAESILSEWNLTSISLKRWRLRRGQSPRAAEAPAAKNELSGRQIRLIFVRGVHDRLCLRHRTVDRDFRLNSSASAWRRVNA